MRLLLAPMEGVIDHHLRALLTQIGGIDICVTEFIRVTDRCLPERVFKRLCPELAQGSQTANGTPVRLQLLGGQAAPVAENAAKAAAMGACAIDLNFGCPAKTVNKSDGGACLLKTPKRVYDIIYATRQSVPANIPVTAKIRLGYEDRSQYLENALAAYEAGANELTVHARSKADGYRPPAYWEAIGEIRQAINMPVIANGEIWSIDDFQRCRQVSGCQDFMLGRGILACPDLACQIKAAVNKQSYQPMAWHEILNLLYRFFNTTVDLYPQRHTGNRLKQWLSYLRRQYAQADRLFEQIKRLKDKHIINQILLR